MAGRVTRYTLVMALSMFAACTELKQSAPVALSDAGEPEEDAQLSGDDAAARLDANAADAGATRRDAASDAGVCVPSCLAPKICSVTSGEGRCEVPTIRWFVDDVLVAEYATHEAIYYATGATQYFLAFPYFRRSVQIYLPQNLTVGAVTACPQSALSMSLITSDNSYAGLSALPARWRNLIFTSCGAQSEGDQVIARDLTLTNASATRLAGSYEFIVKGAGPRANSTLRVTGAFDVAPTVQ
jgi:hypothetical protein